MANNFREGFAEQHAKTSNNVQKFLKDSVRFRSFFTVLVFITLIVSVFSLISSLKNMNSNSTPITVNQGSDGNSSNFTEGSIAEVANKVSPSVVSIITEANVQNFFGQSSTSSGAGTGIIVSENGYILTNKHVASSGTKSIQVVTADGQIFDKVSIVATDPLNDIAFLKIENASGLKAATLGNSKTITAGQQVVAIGNALGEYQNTITSGIISGTGRSLVASDGQSSASAEALSDMIQTDAAINSGNSGGPLINAAGEVIGVNTATTSGADNIGFAIPITSVKGMLKGLLETEKGERAYLGVRTITITPEVATAKELPTKTGAYVYSSDKYSAIVKDSPAAKAGIKEKDIVTAVNGSAVGSGGSVSTLIGEYKPGDTVQLAILRDGKTINVNVTLEAYK